MTKITKAILPLFLFFFFFAVSGVAQAYSSRNAHGNLFLDYAEPLALTKDQVGKIKKIKEKRTEKIEKIMKDLTEARTEFNKYSHGEKASRSKMKKFSRKIGELRGKKLEIIGISLMDASEVLSKEQREKAWKIFEAHAQAGMDSYHAAKLVDVKCDKCGESAENCKCEKGEKCSECGKSKANCKCKKALTCAKCGEKKADCKCSKKS